MSKPALLPNLSTVAFVLVRSRCAEQPEARLQIYADDVQLRNARVHTNQLKSYQASLFQIRNSQIKLICSQISLTNHNILVLFQSLCKLLFNFQQTVFMQKHFSIKVIIIFGICPLNLPIILYIKPFLIERVNLFASKIR